MLGAIRALLIPKPPAAVHTSYIALVAAARNPFFFTDLKVPDTLDGRFDLIVLHLFLLQHRIVMGESPGHAATQAEQEAFCQFLGEAFVNDLDANLREMGVADTGVGKRIKVMGKSYHGRLQAYTAALENDETLRHALARNLYGTVIEGDVAVLSRMVGYIRKAEEALARTDMAILLSGGFTWPQPA